MSQIVRRSATAFMLLTAAGTTAFAQAPASVVPPPAPLTRALDTVTSDEIRHDIFFIASDELNPQKARILLTLAEQQTTLVLRFERHGSYEKKADEG